METIFGEVSVTTCRCGDFLLFDVVNVDGKWYHKYYCQNKSCNYVPNLIEVRRKRAEDKSTVGKFDKVELEI